MKLLTLIILHLADEGSRRSAAKRSTRKVGKREFRSIPKPSVFALYGVFSTLGADVY